MKKVFSNSREVMHLYANQIQDEAKTSSRNVYYKGGKIYSYGHHYLLGEFLDSNTILINDEGYSVTTSKHIAELTQATGHKRQFFKKETDLANVLHFIQYNVKKLKRANKPDLYTSVSFNIFKKLNEYIDYTEDKSIRKTIEYLEIETLINAIKENPKTSIEALQLFQIKKEKKEERLKKSKLKKESKLFKSHKINRLSVYVHDLLRVSKDMLSIETSQGISIDVSQAKRLLDLIDAKKIIGSKVNDTYTITAFNGFLRSGCHNIPLSEINLIRESLKTN